MQFFIFRSEAFLSFALKSSFYDKAFWVHNEPTMLIMGSSVARYGISPEIILRNNNSMRPYQVINISADAATPFEMYNSYNNRKSILSRAKTVYYTIEPWLFSTKYYRHKKYEKKFLSLRQQINIYGASQGVASFFLPYRDLLNTLALTTSGNRIDTSAPHGTNKNIYAPPWNGYVPLHGNKPIMDDATFLEDFEPYSLFPLSDFQFHYLKQLKQLVENNGGEFIAVIVPKHERWLAYYREHCSTFDADFTRKFNEIIGPLKVIGTNNGSKYGMLENDYFDLHHVNNTGAAKFTAAEFSGLGRHDHLKPALLPLYSRL